VTASASSDQLAEAFGVLSSFAKPRMVTLRIGDLERQLAHAPTRRPRRIFAPRT